MKGLDVLLDLLFPPRCVFCRRLTQKGARVCPRCMAELPYTRAAAKQEFPHVRACVSPLYYTDEVRASLLRYKFAGVSSYADAYGDFLSKCIDENGITCDSISWVPLSRARLRRRGYDQARLLAEALSSHTGLPCAPTLRKKRNNPAQSSIGSAENRRKNVRDLYVLIPGTQVRGKRILLADDIVTTGATLSACAAVLKKAGAAEVYAVTVARRKD